MADISTRFPARAAVAAIAVLASVIPTACTSSSSRTSESSAVVSTADGPSPTAIAPSTATAVPVPTTGGVATTAAAPTTTAPTTTAPIEAAVPAYFGPSPLWDVMLGTANAGEARVRIAVMNPANGPGPTADAGYARVVAAARTKGIRVLGYVATGYAARTTVLEDIDAYKRLYGLTDIFLDEATTDCSTLAVYRPWIAAVRANGGIAAVNPGIVPAACWGGAADVIVTFEGSFGAYLGSVGAPWMRQHPPSMFWNIVYAVPVDAIPAVRAQAARLGVGLLYATDDVLPNPYDSLPAALSVVTVPPSTAPPISAPPIALPPVIVSAPATPVTAVPSVSTNGVAAAAATTTRAPLIIVLPTTPTTTTP